MIESLSISKTATYGTAPQVLDRLARFNFIFGTNGAGKTTITRVIASPENYPDCAIAWKKGTRLEAMVYNRDFVDRNFNAAPRLKGIFTLGEQDIATLDAIAAKKTGNPPPSPKIPGPLTPTPNTAWFPFRTFRTSTATDTPSLRSLGLSVTARLNRMQLARSR